MQLLQQHLHKQVANTLSRLLADAKVAAEQLTHPPRWRTPIVPTSVAFAHSHLVKCTSNIPRFRSPNVSRFRSPNFHGNEWY